MKTNWIGDAELVRAVERTFHPTAAAAVAMITPTGAMTATAGASDDSAFEIGSISKVLTGMLYRDVMERGLISQETVLGDLLPITNAAVRSLPLSALAIHQSGLPGLPPAMQPVRRSLRYWVRGDNPYGDTLDELLEQTNTLRLRSPRFRYSNLGFQLLGHAVARAAGSSYVDLLTDVLGDGFRAPARADDLGPADLIGAGRFGRRYPAWVGEALAPAGGVRATIGTMSRFLGSLLDGTARGISALDSVSTVTPRLGIGAGWLTITQPDRTITWHNGRTGGFASCIGLDRAAGTGVVVLSATSRSVDRLGFRLVTELAARPADPGARVRT